MLQRTVACWNGTAAADAAVAWAVRRSHDTGTTVELFDVLERDLFAGDPDALERASVQEEQRFATMLANLAETHPGAVSASALLVGDPLELLRGQTGPETLVVVGTSDRTGPRVRYGWSLGARLAAAARGPVAIVPREDEQRARERSGVVVGIDGSDVGSYASAIAASEADALHQRLTVVHCWQEPLADEPLIVPDDDFIDWQQRAHQELLDAEVQAVRAGHPGLSVTPVLLRRNPVAGLRLASEHANMLVVGSRRLTGWKRAWLGSVSHALVLDLAAPTVVVGPDE
jgi:nucleotide-binding universal stress UspA family protein